jgi:hypothetical protein
MVARSLREVHRSSWRSLVALASSRRIGLGQIRQEAEEDPVVVTKGVMWERKKTDQ